MKILVVIFAFLTALALLNEHPWIFFGIIGAPLLVIFAAIGFLSAPRKN